MREILFRGKRIDNGEWIQGFLSKSRNTEEKPALLKFCIDYEENGVMYSAIVDPETIGQYTGLTDKNGKRIFEGDIIKHYNRKDDSTIFDTGRVFWRGEYARFLRTSEDECKYFLIEDMSCPYEVIGNIYDNPELLKGDPNGNHDQV